MKNLIGLGITLGLSDRENFSKQVSGLIQKYNDDPAMAEKWASTAVEYLDNLRNNLQIQSAIRGAVEDSSLPSSDEVKKLTESIEALTKELQQHREKK